MMKVIITGANGFIGKHLIKKLLSENMEIFAVVRTKPETEAGCIGKIHWIEGDLYEDPGIVIETLKECGAENADCFYHLAWNGVAACDKNDSKVQMTNITISMNAISVCKNVYCKRFVYPGSVSEYAGLDGIIHEKSIPSPADIYGAEGTCRRWYPLRRWTRVWQGPWRRRRPPAPPPGWPLSAAPPGGKSRPECPGSRPCPPHSGRREGSRCHR